MTYEECKPTWEVAMLVHSNALGNDSAPYATKRGAQEEIVRAGKLIDTMQGDISDLLTRKEITPEDLSAILFGTYERKGKGNE